MKGNDRAVVGPLTSIATGSGPIVALEKALPANSSNGMADQQTDMRVITRVVETLKHAGYDNVLFASNRRPVTTDASSHATDETMTIRSRRHDVDHSRSPP